MDKPSILIVDDDQAFRDALGRVLRGSYDVRGAGSLSEAMAQLSPPPNAIVLDLRLDEDDVDNRDGLLILEKLQEDWPQIPVLMITAHGDIDLAVECMRLGAVDFLEKRSDVRETKARLEQALQRGKLKQRVQQLERDLSLVEPRKIIGTSTAITAVKRAIEAVARDGAVTVLLRGLTGTGKELVARAIHASGRRQSGPFVPVMLNSLPASMMETELFGYEAGAFTDARERRIGYLEGAHSGVLFLDEIGELETQLQVKLLRLLEEREFQRLGSTRPVRLDVQVVAATNADLEHDMQTGKFRRDLYYRLQGHEIRIPPLRERPEDIPLLLDHFLQLFRQQGKRVHRMAPAVVTYLQHLPWPGNIRQLRNAVESAIFHAELNGHQHIELTDLPRDLLTVVAAPAAAANPPSPGQSGFSVKEGLDRTELAYIVEALRATGGRKVQASEMLYSNRFALRRRVRDIFTRHPTLAHEFRQLAIDDSADD